MSIMVTGGTGTIGSNIARMLVEQGRGVVVYDVAPPPPKNVLNDVLDHLKIEIGNVTDLPRILDVIKTHKVEGIIHCVALVAAPSKLRLVEAL